MELEQQVCSLDLSKKLKELSVEQDSAFYWTNITDKYGIKLKSEVVYWEPTSEFNNGKTDDILKKYYSSAFTVAELGVLLPPFYKSHRFFDLWYCEYTDQYNHVERCIDDTEADARANMLIYLIENKLIVLQ